MLCCIAEPPFCFCESSLGLNNECKVPHETVAKRLNGTKRCCRRDKKNRQLSESKLIIAKLYHGEDSGGESIFPLADDNPRPSH